MVDLPMLGALVTPHERVLVVPPNQRPWSWTEKEIDEFVSDLLITLRRTHEVVGNGRWTPRRTREQPHFFGTLVFDVQDNQSDDLGMIVDGQQRLTALCLVASCLKVRLRELIADRGLHGEELSEANSLLQSFDDWLYGRDANGEPVPKLELDPRLQPFFEELVLDSASRDDRDAVARRLGLDSRMGKSEHPVENRLLVGLRHVQALLDGVVPDTVTPAELSWIRAINVTLRHAFGVVVLKTANEQFSYSVFSWLNARGTELSEADKIKAELFDRSTSVEHEQIASAWSKMLDAAPQQDAQAFLRHHHIAFVGPAELRKLYVTVTQDEIAPATTGYEVVGVVMQWQKRAEGLRDLMAAAPGSAMPEPCRRAVDAIVSVLGYSLVRPLLLAAGERFLPGDWDSATKCIRLGLHYAFRMLTVGGEQESRLERTIGEVSRMLTLEGKGVADIASVLRQANPDATFEQRFSEYGTNRTAIQFYILNEIERSLSRGGLVPAEHGQDTNNIEHILPRNLSRTRLTEWKKWRDPTDPLRGSDEHKLYRNRIGNLLLLEANINSEVGNYDFMAKKTGSYPGRATTVSGRSRFCFGDSQLRLPKALVADSTTDWTKAAIERRQEALSKTALKVWTLQPRSL